MLAARARLRTTAALIVVTPLMRGCAGACAHDRRADGRRAVDRGAERSSPSDRRAEAGGAGDAGCPGAVRTTAELIVVTPWIVAARARVLTTAALIAAALAMLAVRARVRTTAELNVDDPWIAALSGRVLPTVALKLAAPLMAGANRMSLSCWKVSARPGMPSAAPFWEPGIAWILGRKVPGI
jgi:hypothetical protein